MHEWSKHSKMFMNIWTHANANQNCTCSTTNAAEQFRPTSRRKKRGSSLWNRTTTVSMRPKPQSKPQNTTSFLAFKPSTQNVHCNCGQNSSHNCRTLSISYAQLEATPPSPLSKPSTDLLTTTRPQWPCWVRKSSLSLIPTNDNHGRHMALMHM